ncbi:MAG: molybdopterin oxidoreductase family protein [Actinomycetota bacterium]
MTDEPPAHSHCPYCALNCGFTLTRVDEAGDIGLERSRWKESPLTRGAVCSKGTTAHLQVRHDERLTRPLRRVRNDFVEIGWDEALDQAAEGFRRIRDHHGAAANAVLSGGSLLNEKVYLIGKLARLAFGTPNVDYNGRFCMTAAGVAHKRAFGTDRMMTPLAEIEHTDAVVVSGANISTSFPVYLPQAIARLRGRGGRVIVVDPRPSRFVKPDDLLVALRPGTDAALWNGVLRAVAHRSAVDHAFLADRTHGIDEALAAAEPWDRATTCGVTDVAPAVFDELVDAVSNAARCVYLHGRGSEQQATGVANVAALINVGLARGHVGREGCGINMLTGQRNGQGGREWGQRCNQLPAGRDIDDPSHRAVVAERWGVDADELPSSGRTYVEILQMASRSEIRGMLAFATNIAVSSPDLHRVRRQLDALEHLVVVDPFFSATAAHADLVLPGSTFAEETGTITTIEGRAVLVEQAIEPVTDLTDFDVIAGLAQRLGHGDKLTYPTTEAVFTEMRQVSAGGPVDYAGMSYQRLRDEGGLFWPCPAPEHPGTPMLYTERFDHDDGRARLTPVHPNPPTTDVERPLVLTNGRVLAQFLSGNQTMRIPEQHERDPDPYVEVHPETAARVGLLVDQYARLESTVGVVDLPWRPNDALRPDTAFMPYHWAACNELVEATLDPECSIPAFKHTAVKLTSASRFTEPSHGGDVVLAHGGKTLGRD